MLTGKIEINEQTITEWTAENTGERDGDEVKYVCVVSGRDNRGYPFVHQFNVWHNPNDGALELTKLILGRAMRY